MERLREARKKKHLTMKQLGAMVGVTEAAISHYELGKRQPDYDLAVKFSECLGVSVDYLLGREEQQPPAKEEYPAERRAEAKMMLESMTDDEYNATLQYMKFLKSQKK